MCTRTRVPPFVAVGGPGGVEESIDSGGEGTFLFLESESACVCERERARARLCACVNEREREVEEERQGAGSPFFCKSRAPVFMMKKLFS